MAEMIKRNKEIMSGEMPNDVLKINEKIIAGQNIKKKDDNQVLSDKATDYSEQTVGRG